MSLGFDATGQFLQVTAELKYAYLLQYSISEVILTLAIHQTFIFENDETHVREISANIRIIPDY